MSHRASGDTALTLDFHKVRPLPCPQACEFPHHSTHGTPLHSDLTTVIKRHVLSRNFTAKLWQLSLIVASPECAFTGGVRA